MKTADAVPMSTVHVVASAHGANPAAPDPVRVRFDRFELDETNALLVCDGKSIALARKPFALLCALARQPGALLTKNALLDEVWGHQFVSDSVLKTSISDLRTVLGDDSRNPRYIETVSRRGYRFIAATTVISTVPSCPADLPASGAPERHARTIDTSTGVIGLGTPRAEFATVEEMLCAQHLWLQLKALFLDHSAPAAQPLSAGADWHRLFWAPIQ